MSCKSFSGRASELVTDLQAILDPSVPNSSSLTTHRTAGVGEGEGDSGDRAGDGDDFFVRAESPDDHVGDDAQ